MRDFLSGYRSSRPAPRQARVADGRRIYAVGDIHGYAGLLDELHRLVLADAERAGAARNVAIYLGDYVDRGSDSAGVIERLIDQPLVGFESIQLRGNHEEMFLDFLDDPDTWDRWAGNGAAATLASYGVAVTADKPSSEALCRALKEHLPERHLSFLRGLPYSYTEGDYWFVHAGIRPGVPLDSQSPADMLWIRDRFLRSEADHGKVVVHGHTPSAAVEQFANRIGVDTGVYYSGRLSCIVLEGTDRRVIHTGEPGP